LKISAKVSKGDDYVPPTRSEPRIVPQPAPRYQPPAQQPVQPATFTIDPNTHQRIFDTPQQRPASTRPRTIIYQVMENNEKMIKQHNSQKSPSDVLHDKVMKDLLSK